MITKNPNKTKKEKLNEKNEYFRNIFTIIITTTKKRWKKIINEKKSKNLYIMKKIKSFF